MAGKDLPKRQKSLNKAARSVGAPAGRQHRPATKIARGRFARVLVLRGKKEKTVGGVTRDGLKRNKRGRVVSKKMSALAKAKYRHIEKWVDSLVAARKALHLQGFVAINGNSMQGKALYVKTKDLFGEGLQERTLPKAAAAVPKPAAAAWEASVWPAPKP
mmetsp:Transcript_51650/g.138704  ORF Transcript_51650/g.138704 Transcript_51650/m.138704 type:complete len:160 (-) Transcript_51650:73-552(-)